MNKIMNALIMCALFAPLAAAQFAAAGDSVYTVPARPTTKDSITYNFYDPSACCCAEFVNPSVSVLDTIVYLHFSVNTAPCQLCRCLLPGVWNAFKGGPLKAGRYAIYSAQSLYCPPGTACPAIVMLPVRIGEVTVTSSTSAIQKPSADVPVGRMVLAQEKNTINLSCFLERSGSVRVNVFNARGGLADEIYNGHALPGAHRFSWTAAAPGVYFMSVEANGVVAATRKVIVSR